VAESPAPSASRSSSQLDAELSALAEPLVADLERAHRAREVALAACRATIRSCGNSIRAVHRLEHDGAAALADAAEASLREAQEALAAHPQLRASGPLMDAEKEYAEARLTAALVAGAPLPGPEAVGVSNPAWLNGLAEAASELRRHLLDRLRAGELNRAEELLGAMDAVYGLLVTVDFPDALTGGLRRTTDALRAVLERTRGDLTITVLQTRLQSTIESRLPPS
jgi:translin